MKLKDADNLFYIGGVVRDEILGAKSFDIDLTYVGDAVEFAKNLEDAEILQINEPFKTVRIKFNGEEIDIASTRAEIYEKAGHLPTVTKIGCSLKEDVLRRDFTINALAKNYKTGEIIDYTNGLSDIKNKILKVLHDKSFIEDPTRILRALKFAVRFDFKLDNYSKSLQDEYLKNINYDMSYKRIKKELIETFNLNSQAAYDEFINAGIYKLLSPMDFIKPKANIENLVNKYKSRINPNNIWLIYTGTLPDLSNIEPALTREEKKIIEDYSSLKSKNLKSDFEIYKAFENCLPETTILYAILADFHIAERYLDFLSGIRVNLRGEDLKNLGIEPSEKYKLCFDFILENKFNNPDMTYEEELSLARKYFRL